MAYVHSMLALLYFSRYLWNYSLFSWIKKVAQLPVLSTYL
jgi:hypothetical protein